jgi:16S rRNA (adenine1518-N6/adenine1519-N6)-dimethyltransferase
LSELPRVPRRASWAEIKRALESSGFRPSRALGQNFLVDENMLRAIARDSGVGPEDFVLEVGPGCGVLTAHLLDAGAHVLAVELDPRLHDFARHFLAGSDVEWLLGDALAGKHALAPALVAALPRDRDWHLVSNLPYSAGTPILVACSRLDRPPVTATVLVQADLAERITAEPGGREWGALSARLQAVYVVRRLRTLPPGLFWPRPQVDSALVRLDRRERWPTRDELDELDRLVACLFEQRRKTVRNRLEQHYGSRERADDACRQLEIDPRARPENLGLKDLLALAARR